MIRTTVIRFALACLAVGGTGCQSRKETPMETPKPPEAQPAAAAAPLRCEMSVPASLKVGEPVPLRFRLTNPSAQALHVLTWQTPLEGFFGGYLKVTRDGVEVPYAGPMVKRGDPSAEEYTAVAPGGSAEATVDVALPYDMKQPGRYRLEFVGQLMDVTPRKEEVPRPLAAHQPVPLQCPAVETTLTAP